MRCIGPLKNPENRSVTGAIKNAYIKNTKPVCQNSKKHLFHVRYLF